MTLYPYLEPSSRDILFYALSSVSLGIVGVARLIPQKRHRILLYGFVLLLLLTYSLETSAFLFLYIASGLLCNFTPHLRIPFFLIRGLVGSILIPAWVMAYPGPVIDRPRWNGFSGVMVPDPGFGLVLFLLVLSLASFWAMFLKFRPDRRVWCRRLFLLSMILIEMALIVALWIPVAGTADLLFPEILSMFIAYCSLFLYGGGGAYCFFLFREKESTQPEMPPHPTPVEP